MRTASVTGSNSLASTCPTASVRTRSAPPCPARRDATASSRGVGSLVSASGAAASPAGERPSGSPSASGEPSVSGPSASATVSGGVHVTSSTAVPPGSGVSSTVAGPSACPRGSAADARDPPPPAAAGSSASRMRPTTPPSTGPPSVTVGVSEVSVASASAAPGVDSGGSTHAPAPTPSPENNESIVRASPPSSFFSSESGMGPPRRVVDVPLRTPQCRPASGSPGSWTHHHPLFLATPRPAGHLCAPPDLGSRAPAGPARHAAGRDGVECRRRLRCPGGTRASRSPRRVKMPVFTRVRDGILVLTVDGDYTANELRRVALGAFGSEETPSRVPVLLDMSGGGGPRRQVAGGAAGERRDLRRVPGSDHRGRRRRFGGRSRAVRAGR